MPDIHRQALAAACLALAACQTPVAPFAEVHYRQIGACIHAQTGAGPVSAPPSHAIVLFRVSHVDNSKTGKGWSFDANRLTLSDMLQNLGSTGPVAIPAGKDVAVNQPVGILVATSNADGSDAASTNYLLMYPAAPPAPGVFSAKDNVSQVQYPFAADCNVLAGG